MEVTPRWARAGTLIGVQKEAKKCIKSVEKRTMDLEIGVLSRILDQKDSIFSEKTLRISKGYNGHRGSRKYSEYLYTSITYRLTQIQSNVNKVSFIPL